MGHHGGGIASLAAALADDCWDAVEADFDLHYRRDLRVALGPDGPGCRRLWVLIKGLPPESNYKRLTEGDARPDLAEHLDAWMRTLLEWSSAKPGTRVKLPPEISRRPAGPESNGAAPPPEPKRIATDDPAQIAAVFEELKSG